MAILCLVPAVPAAASSIQVGGSRITYSAADGEANALTVTRSGGNYVFTEAAGVTVVPLAPCSAGPTNVGTCPAAGISSFEIFLGNLDDSAALEASVPGGEIEFNRMVGGAGDDTLIGGPSVRSQLDGDGQPPDGNDTLTGGPLNDTLFAGGGNDTITGGDGDDRLEPGDGDDVANAGPGFDSLSSSSAGPDGADTYSGGPQIDLFTISRSDAQRISLNNLADDGGGCPGAGCEGDDVRADVEDVRSGDGDDVVVGDGDPNDLNGGAGNDLVSGRGGNDDIGGEDGDDTLRGGTGPDRLGGSVGADRILGDRGDDRLFSEFFDDEADVVGGGPGTDRFEGGSEFAFGVRIDLDGKPDDGFTSGLLGPARDNVRPDVEDLVGTDAADVLIGGSGPNELTGGAGSDRLVGGDGPDALLGERGSDSLTGGPARDLLESGAGPDRIASRDRTPDQVSCGGALDRVTADRSDRTTADCDRVRRR